MNKSETNEMADKHLDELLKAADPVVAPNSLNISEDLPRRVRGLYRRRRRRRRIAGVAFSVATTAAVVLFVLVSINKRSTPTTVALPATETLETIKHTAPNAMAIVPKKDAEPNSTVAANVELAQFRERIHELRTALKRSRRQAEYRRRLAKLRRGGKPPDPTVLARSELEKTAYLLVSRAAREEVSRRPGNGSTVAYQKAIDLFPDTTWAKIAQHRLDNPLDNTN